MKTANPIIAARFGVTRARKFNPENKFTAACRGLFGALLLAAFFALVLLLALVSTAGTAHAQQTIFKWKAYDGGDNGLAVVVGDHLFLPARNRDLVTYDVGNYVYAQVSKTFKTNTRLTAGAYHFSQGVVAPEAQRAGGQFGFEQPVTSRFGIAADYYTGKHAAGYFTPGVNFKPHPRVTGYVGYSIGNSNPGGNNFFYTAVGVNFN